MCNSFGIINHEKIFAPPRYVPNPLHNILFSVEQEGKMAAGNTGFCYEDIPEISPITTKYMIINWVNIVQDVDGIVMKNFDVSRCYYWLDNKTVYLNDYPWEFEIYRQR